MPLEAAIALGLVAAATVLALLPVRLVLAARVRGASNGAWAASAGAELPGVTAGFARARGTATLVDVRVLGRPVSLERRKRRLAPPEATPRSKLESLERAWARFTRWLDPLDVIAFLLTETRRVSVRDVDGTVHVALRDVVLAGQTAGALAIVSALVSPFGCLSHAVEFGAEDRLDASLSFAIRFRPALLVADAVWFLLRSLRIRPPPQPAKTEVLT